MLLDSLSVQPNVKSLIGDKGVTYEKHFCTVAWCCPSRVNFFTGRAAHNTNLTSAQPPYGKGTRWSDCLLVVLTFDLGGWTKFGELGLNDNYLPVWLQDAGVNTYYVGKFMNGYKRYNLATPAPPRGELFNITVISQISNTSIFRMDRFELACGTLDIQLP
jgi:N-acetylglucosamine-6-sulfatase